MSIRRSVERFRAQAGARQVYQRSFVAHVHQLLAAGFSQLEPKTLRDQEEPAITGLLVKAIRHYLEGPAAPQWSIAFAVHDDPPVEYQNRTGRARPRVDIELERAQPGRRPRFQFEAKRLYRGDSINEYLGEDGLLSFLSGKYAAEHEDAGMLGYVQEQPVRDWVARIQQRMKDGADGFFLDARKGTWRSRADPELEHSYSSLHMRAGRLLLIHHTFLECC